MTGRARGRLPAPRLEGDWRHRAVCRDADLELFFPVGTSGPALAQVDAAKAVCASCPVIAECLAFATWALPDGIAGGLTAAERARARGEDVPVRRSESQDRRETARRLRAHGWPARQIAHQIGVNERSVYRLLKQAVA